VWLKAVANKTAYDSDPKLGWQLLLGAVCAQHGHLLYIERYIINLEGASPLWAGVTP